MGLRDDAETAEQSETRSLAPGGHVTSSSKINLDEAQQIVGERYRIEQIAGDGGMGRVFTANDQRLDRRVAIKFLTGPIGPVARETLLMEARAMASLRHPSIAPVHEAVVDTECPFIVMGWIDGREMDVAWRDLDLEQRVTMVEQVMEAVAELHASNLVHLDIKPKNILVDHFGVPVLVDFETSRLVLAMRGRVCTRLDFP
jgi:serine/threonine-protein kinase